MEMVQRYKSEKDFKVRKHVKISNKLAIFGGDNIHLDIMDVIEDDVILRGDLGRIQISKGTIIGERTVVHPCIGSAKPPFEYKCLFIGHHCYIGSDCILACRNIGNNVWVGDNCILGDRTDIGSQVKILPNTYIPPDTKIPDNSVYGGHPGKYIGEITEAFDQFLEEFCNDYYLNLIITQDNLN